MGWLQLQPQFNKSIPMFINLSSPPPLSIPLMKDSSFNLNVKLSSALFVIMIIFAIIFFTSGLLHLLVRFFLRPSRTRELTDEIMDVTSLEGQLQQLFHLHDAGIDQAYIDTFPVFIYKSIVDVESPFDCAVCLSEFEPEDKLRLLPKCSHAFHMNCTDTWLLSHSTCPLCRATLFPDISSNHYCSPLVLVLESGSESSREIGVVDRVNSQLSSCSENEFRAPLYEILNRSCEIQLKEDEKDKILQVKLGKFKNVDGEGCSENNVEVQRRCFSMGSFAYVMDENSTLKVPIRTPLKKVSRKKPALSLIPGHSAAMSECDRDHSRREFNDFLPFGSIQESENEVIESKAIRGGKESFSISKIWLKGWKEKQNSTIGQSSSRRAFSSRFPLQCNGVAGGIDESKPRNGGSGGSGGSGGGGGGRGAISEVEVDRWENGGSEYSYDVEMQSCYSMDSQANPPSFARKTLVWLMGNVSQNKVLHSSFSSNL